MPRMNKTGPLGKGPMTGRGLGKCEDDNQNLEDKELEKNERGYKKNRGRRILFNSPSS